MGHERILGFSTHSLEQAREALAWANILDYIAVGPVYATPTKPEYSEVGLSLIQQVVSNGHKKNRWVGSCGEMSGDPAVALLLLGLEIDEISTSPLALPKVKKVIRSVKFKDAKSIAKRALKFSTGKEVMDYLTVELKKVAEDLVE